MSKEAILESLARQLEHKTLEAQLTTACIFAGSLNSDFYGTSFGGGKQFRVVNVIHGDESSSAYLAIRLEEVENNNADPFELCVEWICDEILEDLSSITESLEGDPEPEYDAFRQSVSFFLEIRDIDDSEDDPPTQEEIDHHEIVSAILVEACLLHLFILKKDTWECM